MRTPPPLHATLKIGLVLTVCFTALSLRADPIELPERSVTPQIAFAISISILLEAICWLLCLRRFQKPRFFILWILGMHLITFPAFVELLRFLDTLRPAVAVLLGEGLVVLVEGFLVFLICNYFARSSQNAQPPALIRCWVVSLAGNLCSAAAFPILTTASNWLK